LAAEELKVKMQQIEIGKAQSKIQEAKDVRAELDQEWEAEQEHQRLASEKHSRTWKETALRSQLCQARLKAMEQEGAQLRSALGQPEQVNQVWDAQITKLKAEKDIANVEAAEAKREHDRLLAESLRADHRRSMPSGAQIEADAASDIPVTTAQPLVSAQSAQSGRRPSASPVSPEPNLSTTSASTAGKVTSQAMANAASTLQGLLRPGTTLSPTSQLSAAGSTTEAPYSTTSILNDARRALEKLEQLKVRRGTGNASYTGPAPSGPARSAASATSMEAAAAAGAAAANAAARVTPATQMPQRTAGHSPSPQTSAQVPVNRRPPQSPMALKQITSPQLSASSAPAGSKIVTASKGAAPMRPQAVAVGKAGSASPAMQSSPVNLKTRASPARQLGSPGNSVPPTPDGASRMFSVSRGAPKQAVPATLSPMTGGASRAGAPQDYGVVRQQLRSS
jgi:hypothetical protein